MSDMIDMYRDLKEYRARMRAAFGKPCPQCASEQPKRQPTILEPGMRCRVHKPAYVDPRGEPSLAEIDAALADEPTPVPPAYVHDGRG